MHQIDRNIEITVQKKDSQRSLEQKAYHSFNPSDIKKTIEVPVKQKPNPEDLQTIEKVGGN